MADYYCKRHMRKIIGGSNCPKCRKDGSSPSYGSDTGSPIIPWTDYLAISGSHTPVESVPSFEPGGGSYGGAGASGSWDSGSSHSSHSSHDSGSSYDSGSSSGGDSGGGGSDGGGGGGSD